MIQSGKTLLGNWYSMFNTSGRELPLCYFLNNEVTFCMMKGEPGKVN